MKHEPNLQRRSKGCGSIAKKKESNSKSMTGRKAEMN
jgi:hypothetical protein